VRLAAGDAEREPGGVRVDRKRDAAEGFAPRRSRRGSSDASDWARGCASLARDWRWWGDLMAAAAAMGRDWTDSAKGALSRGCMKIEGGSRGAAPEEKRGSTVFRQMEPCLSVSLLEGVGRVGVDGELRPCLRLSSLVVAFG
jgi:hypothetical protein